MSIPGVVLRQPGDPPGATELSNIAPAGSVTGCPYGLEALIPMDKILCRQDRNLLEAFGWECKNKYKILDSQKQQLFYMFEESGVCHRLMCGPLRGFHMHVLNHRQEEVMHIIREFQCCKGWCPCCSDGSCMYPIIVTDKHERRIGMVRKLNFCCTPLFGIFDENDQMIYQMTGPCCPCQCCCICTADLVYPFRSPGTEEPVGSIHKVWAGTFNEVLTDKDNYDILVPPSMEVKHKALLLAAMVILDFYFEELEEQN